MTDNTMTCKRIADELAEICNDYEALIEYFDDALDIEYRVGADRQYRSVRIMVACGGPNIFIDTKTGCVELYWGTDHTSWTIRMDVVDSIDSLFSEHYEMY